MSTEEEAKRRLFSLERQHVTIEKSLHGDCERVPLSSLSIVLLI